MKSRSKIIFEKSLSAMMAAIEIYNKPQFQYREETFSILAVNAWELLLKARILQIASNNPNSIVKYERKKTKTGEKYKNKTKVKNSSGTYQTIGLAECIRVLENDYGSKLEDALKTNIKCINEIRNNSVHLTNKGIDLIKKIQEFGLANVKNYMDVSRIWFGVDLTQYNFFLMPMTFIQDGVCLESIIINKDESQVLTFLEKEANIGKHSKSSLSNVSIKINMVVSKGDNLQDGQKVIYSNDPKAIPINIKDQEMMHRYPWDYNVLTKRLKDRYADFKQNNKYHTIRGKLKKEQRYSNERFLDPGNMKSQSKDFFNPSIVNEFDKHYSRKS